MNSARGAEQVCLGGLGRVQLAADVGNCCAEPGEAVRLAPRTAIKGEANGAALKTNHGEVTCRPSS